MITISVIIPCYNREDTVAEAIASVKLQTRPPLEILVIDDGSTDASAEIAEAAGATVIRLPVNLGNAGARNAGIRAASGQAIAWLDSDDYWEHNHLEIVAALLDNYPEAAVASAAIRFSGTRSGTWYPDVPEGSPSNIVRRAFRDTPIPMATSVVRRDALLTVGGFDESKRSAVDFDIWLKLSVRHTFVASREITATYRCHENQISATPERQWSAAYHFRGRALEEIRRDGNVALAEELSAVFQQRWIHDVQSAWDAGRISWLRELLTLASLVPHASRRLRWEWRLRLLIPPVVVSAVRSIRSGAVSALL